MAVFRERSICAKMGTILAIRARAPSWLSLGEAIVASATGSGGAARIERT
jgi:hypothetical protein